MAKLNFTSIKRDSYKLKASNEKKDKQFIKYGEDNQFPDYLISLFNHSSTHAACVNAVVEAVRGEGLVTENEAILDRANRMGESWNDLYSKIALDYKLFGGFALEVIWSRDKTTIAEVYHIDFSYIRAKKKDNRGNCPGYFISNDWKKNYNYSNKVNLNDVPYLPIFDPRNKMYEGRQIYVHQPYSPGKEYYPLPDYVGATKVIDLDQEVDNFHINNITNGLTPSLAITTYTNATDDEREAIERMLREQYAGTNNAGNLIYMDVPAPDVAPTITPIPQNGADTYYTTINDMVVQKILSAHRITSPALLGIKENTGLGNNADEIQTAYRLFLNTVVTPYQQNILSVLEYLLGIQQQDKVTVGVIQKDPLYEGSFGEREVVTSQEADVEDIEEIQEQVDEINESTE
jgi:hypothetical protein